MRMIIGLSLLFFCSSCNFGDNKHYTGSIKTAKVDSARPVPETPDWNYTDSVKPQFINTGRTQPEELLRFAESLKGVPYLYGSTDPAKGLDCSGFNTHFFNHFGIAVPRSSKDFTKVQTPVSLKDSRPGDLILFTGTDSTIRIVGHMGIIADNNGKDIRFIHSTSGKDYGVTTTPLNPYYQGRFVKAIRVFKAGTDDL